MRPREARGDLEMTVTRRPELDPQVAELFQAFNRCSNGSSTDHVMQAAANFMIGAIIGHGRASGASDESIVDLTQEFADALPGLVENQLHRNPRPDDIPVPLRSN
jgi:hypothetical protein